MIEVPLTIINAELENLTLARSAHIFLRVWESFGIILGLRWMYILKWIKIQELLIYKW